MTADQTLSEEYVAELLGIPEHLNTLCIITIGHKDEQRKPIDPSRLEWEKVHIGSWQ